MKKALSALLILVLVAFCLAGCQKQTASAGDANGPAAAETTVSLADYLASVKEKSEAIKASLEQDDLTQNDMNMKSEELRALWDEALNHLLDEAKRSLPEAEMEKLTAAQSTWEEGMKTAVDAAGKEFEGGSLQAFAANTEAAKQTEARVYELYELLK